jgi:hypothetical protein
MMPNVQLTDGGPPLATELPERIAGPPFGGATGWALNFRLATANTSAAAHTAPVASRDHGEAKLQTRVKSASALSAEIFRMAAARRK